MSGMHEAVQSGDLATVKALLIRQPKQHSTTVDFMGCTLLHRAASGGHLEIAKLLIADGSDVNAKGSPSNPGGTPYGTPLHFAASSGHPDVVKLLLACKSQVDSRDKEGRSPLHLAAEKCQLEVARILIANGADVDAADRHGQTPLHSVSDGSDCAEVANLLIQSDALIDARSAIGRTPLHYANMSRRLNVKRLLLEKGANPDLLDVNGKKTWQY